MTEVLYDLERLVAFIASRTGLRLSRQQRERLIVALDSRLEGRTYSDVYQQLQMKGSAHELAQLLAAVSVHKTDLFRDEQQLNALETHALRPMAAEGQALHVWSAGCSTGEEVATLLVLLAEAGAPSSSRVLGTDLSDHALARARPLMFSNALMTRVPPPMVSRYFVAQLNHQHALVPELAARASFQRHNLIDRPYPVAPDGGLFDLIVCRNVLIYFTVSAARDTVSSLVERLRPGGFLVLSAAEPLLDSVAQLSTIRVPGAFLYQKTVGSSPSGQVIPLKSPPRTKSGSEMPAVVTPVEEGIRLFELVLEWAAVGVRDAETEAGLRKALALAPQLAAAHYLLGLILERRKQFSEAADAYRRALSMLDSGTALATSFSVKHLHLAGACRVALTRLGR